MDALKAIAAWAVLTIVVLLLIGSAAGLVVQFGFAWALIVCVVAGVIWARRFDVGPYGERTWFVPIVFIIVAIGLVLGLVHRLVLQ